MTKNTPRIFISLLLTPVHRDSPRFRLCQRR